MVPLGLLLAALPAITAAPLPVDVVEHHTFVDDVYLNGRGPFRFLIDTGAQSSTLSPDLVDRLSLQASYAVIRVTALSEKAMPAYLAARVALGPASAEEVEFIGAPLAPSLGQADGILGMNFLGKFAWLLDRDARILRFDPDGSLARELSGHRIRTREVDGRPAVSARLGGGTVLLVLDSGASHLVLFDRPAPAGVRSGSLESNDGRRQVLAGRVPRLEIGPIVRKDLLAAFVPSPGRREQGLLPVSLFPAVYFHPGYVILGR